MQRTCSLLTVLGSILVCGFVLQGCSVDSSAASQARALSIVGGRKSRWMQPLIEAFRNRHPDVSVTYTRKPTTRWVQILRVKGRPRRADLFVPTTALALEILRRRDLFVPYRSPEAVHIPSQFKAADATWTGFSGRARTLFVNKAKLGGRAIPGTVADLTDDRYRGLVVMAGVGEHTTIAQVAAWIQAGDHRQARILVEKLLANGMQVLPGNSAVRRAVAGPGPRAIGITNSNHYHVAVDAEGGRRADLLNVYPGVRGRGTLVNPLCIALFRDAANPDDARRFIDFVLSAEGQRLIAPGSYEIPLRRGIPAEPVRGLGSFEAAEVSQERIGQLAAQVWRILPDAFKRTGGS